MGPSGARMTDLSPTLLAALHEIAIRKRHQVPPDEALCADLEERGLIVWNFRWGGMTPARFKQYVVTREGEALLRMRMEEGT